MENERQLWKLTRVFKANAAAYLAGQRIIANEGGTSSSKTYSILQLLIQIAQNVKRKFIISVVSESMPHLKRGCIRDFQNILGNEFEAARWNKTDFIYRWPICDLEFFSADQPAKLRGGRRDILFINEANNNAWDAFRELDIRTRLCTFLDWNPVSEFWAHEKGIISDPANAYIHSTYIDARWCLPSEVVANIEAQKTKDPNWWNIYGLGRIGKIEGLVYPAFEQVDALPQSGYEFYGLDFGYASDPTALVKCVIRGDELYGEELIYEAGLTNDAIAHRLDELGVKRRDALIYADSAEPKSIEEIHRYGFNIQGCAKGPDSVEFGHQKIRQFKQFWTKGSLNCIKEMRNLRYIPDKDGKLTSKTTHVWTHGTDARRYAVAGLTGPQEPVDRIVTFDSMQLVRGA